MSDNTRTRRVSIPYEKKEIEGYLTTPDDADLDYSVILTHGAGGDANSANLDFLADYLAEQGFLVLRFTCKGLNINYRVKVFRAVLEWLTKTYSLKGCFLAGRSMGSRAAVLTANQSGLDQFIRGIICLAYPLQKSPHETKEDREQPLRDLAYPTLLISGTNDDMMSELRMNDIIAGNDNLEVFWIDKAGHSLQRRKGDLESVTLVNETVSDWCKKTLGLSASTSSKTNGTRTEKHCERKRRVETDTKDAGRKRRK